MDYQRLNALFEGIPRPFAALYLPALQKNIKDIALRAGNVPIRIASKSVRCRWVLEYVLKNKPYQGIMTYHPEETLWLSQHHFDNLLLGYPYTFEPSLRPLLEEIKKGKDITLMVDLPHHLELLERLGKTYDLKVPVCLDVDMSTDLGWLWFGVKRSSIRTLEQLKERVKQIRSMKHIALKGIMGYEAQIAGLPDKHSNALKGWVVALLKKISIRQLSRRRKAMYEFLKAEGIELKIVNGGGTGSVEKTLQEPYINEVTVGSGLYSSGLFDNYEHFRHSPALFFGIEITRNPERGVYTAAGGGYIASGAIGPEKQPKIFLPAGIRSLATEGFGEVQTPFYSPTPLRVGDCIFLRHAKAGELCEHFHFLYLFDDHRILDTIPTYRGEGKCFL